jgi:hypothetical protein
MIRRIWRWWDHRFGVLLGQYLAQVVGGVAAVGEQAEDPACSLDEGGGHGDVVGISGAEQQHALASCLVGEPVELGRAPPLEQPIP